MPDELNLSLWFPGFEMGDMMPRTLSVLRQFPYSQVRPGITAAAAYPLSWSEAPVYSHSFDFPVAPERAVTLVSEFLHEDYAYEFEALWDLWTPEGDEARLRCGGLCDSTTLPAVPGDAWVLRPVPVKIAALGPRFEDADYRENGHILLRLGLDAPFLYDDQEFGDAEMRVRANVQKLVNFSSAVEKNCGTSGRVLWSESDETLAQKLVARLQRVQ
ncbi:MAG: hypothetical protein JO041_09590 [Acidobacteria bacterium]|nr:hypothetical protein [Acidobacteriota bacterium]